MKTRLALVFGYISIILGLTTEIIIILCVAIEEVNIKGALLTSVLVAAIVWFCGNMIRDIKGGLS